MAAITLYDYELDEHCYRVRLLLTMLGLEWEPHPIDMVPGEEEKQPPMLALNPLGRLPVMQDGDLVLHGAEALLTYIAKTYDGAKTWLPEDNADFGRVMMWLNFSCSVLGAASQARLQSLFGTTGVEAPLKEASRNAFRIMDDHMTKRGYENGEWFVGDHVTLADLALFPAFALSRDYGIDHDEFPALRRWIRRFRNLEKFTTMPGIPDYH